MMVPLETFIWGFGGSLAVEIVTLNQHLTASRTVRLPARYKRPLFWFCRLLLAAMGGGLALAYHIQDNQLLAANIGAAAPLIIQALARGLRPPTTQLPPTE